MQIYFTIISLTLSISKNKCYKIEKSESIKKYEE